MKTKKLLAAIILSITFSSSCSRINVAFQGRETVTPSINVTCPQWTHPNSEGSKCICKKQDFLDGKLQCEHGDLMVLDSYCMTYSVESKTLEVGSCIENCLNTNKSLKDRLYHIGLSLNQNLSSINDLMCRQRFNRAGRLCGKCLPNFHPQAYSYNLTCVTCPEGNLNLWKYFIFSLAPLTAFYFLVLFFKLNTTSSHLHGYVIFAQALALPQFARLLIITIKLDTSFNYPIKALTSLYGLWNLDFFRIFNLGVCLNMAPLSVVTLDYVIAVYPFLLTILSYILIELHDKNIRILVFVWKPFRCVFTLFRRNWDIRTSVVDAYATFFQLSCFKIACISFDLLIPTIVYPLMNDGSKLVLYYDGTVDYFGTEHLPYAIIAIVFTLLFAIIPILLVFVYPSRCFQYLMNRHHWHSHILQTFMDSINGCYKDGTEPGTKDCRWFAGIDLSSRIVLFLVFSFTLGSLYFPLAVLVILLIIIMVSNIKPHKTALAKYTKIDVTFYSLLGLYYTAICACEIASIKARFFTKGCYVVAILISIVPLIYSLCLCLHWIFTKRRWGRTFVNRVRAWRGGYQWLEELPDRVVNPGNYQQVLEESARINSSYDPSGEGINWYTD